MAWGRSAIVARYKKAKADKDAVCEQLTECDASESFETGAPTSTSDRRCKVTRLHTVQGRCGLVTRAFNFVLARLPVPRRPLELSSGHIPRFVLL